MAKNSSTPNLDDLHLDDTDPEDLFASPGQPRREKSTSNGGTILASKARAQQQSLEDADSREVKLRQELENVRRVNKVIEDTVASLEKAKGNMDTVTRTVHNASTLLNTWTRILSQTEHNQRLILNPAWQGAAQDLADVENEAVLRQQATERREMEEQQRRAAAMRKAEEDQRRTEERVDLRMVPRLRPQVIQEQDMWVLVAKEDGIPEARLGERALAQEEEPAHQEGESEDEPEPSWFVLLVFL
ncbi:MAG: hypothetical protein Q9165_004396 [Trypethelium subeluteriae]